MKLVSLLSTLMITAAASVLSPMESSAAGKIYVFESDGNAFNTRTVFFDDGKEVVAFDAQFTEGAAQQAINFLRTKTPNPIKWLVITHPNPDKFNGIPVFQKEGAKVIMSKLSASHLEEMHNYKKYYFVNIAKAFTEDTYPKLPKYDITFEDDYEIKTANNIIIKLHELKQSGVSTNQTVAYIAADSSLIVGDLVHHNVHAWLEGPIVAGHPAYNTANWVNALKTVQSSYPTYATVYGGRGEAAKLSIAIPQQITYLQKAEEITKTYMNSLQGATIADKKGKVEYPALTSAFEKAFPSYGLTYMITYGSYGLVEKVASGK